MAIIPYISCRQIGEGLLPGETKFLFFGNSYLAGNTTESNRQVTVRTACTVSNLKVKVPVNSLSTATTTIRIRINGANGNQVVSFAAGVTGTAEDAVNTDSITAGQLVCFSEVAAAGGSGQIDIFNLTTLVESVDGVLLNTFSGLSKATDSSSSYYAPTGLGTGGSATENNYSKVSINGTAQNLQTNISSNPRSTTSTIRFRKNQANGNQVLSIGAAATGLFEDTTNTDTIVSGDEIGTVLILSTGGGTLVGSSIVMPIADSEEYFFAISLSTGSAIAADTTQSYALAGYTADGTETSLSVALNDNPTLENLYTYISANTRTSTTTFRLRKNAGNANQVISVATTLTGEFQDTSNSDAVLADDLLNYQAITSTGSGSITITNMSISSGTDETGYTNLLLLGVG